MLRTSCKTTKYSLEKDFGHVRHVIDNRFAISVEMNHGETVRIDDLAVAIQLCTIDLDYEWIIDVPWLREQIAATDGWVIEDAVARRAQSLTRLQNCLQGHRIGQTVIIADLNQCRLGQDAVPDEFLTVGERNHIVGS